MLVLDSVVVVSVFKGACSLSVHPVTELAGFPAMYIF